jgi:hypothetical protein
MLCTRHVNALAVVMVEKFFRRAKAVDSTGVVVAAVDNSLSVRYL